MHSGAVPVATTSGSPSAYATYLLDVQSDDLTAVPFSLFPVAATVAFHRPTAPLKPCAAHPLTTKHAVAMIALRFPPSGTFSAVRFFLVDMSSALH
jgi:hypothetical protein